MKKNKMVSVLLCLVLVLTAIGTPVKVSAQGTKIVKSIELNVKSKQTMYVGTSKKIEVKRVTPKGASKKVTFESNKPSVVKVTKNGTMKALKEGKATVTVTSKENSKVRRKIKVTVKNLVKNSTKNKIALPMKNKTHKLKISKKITLSKLKFSSNKKSVATVSKKGVITVKKPGVAKITIKGKKGNVKGAKQTLTVYVAKKAVKNIKLNAKNIKLQKSETYQLQATVLPKGSCEEVFYASSDESVASVSEDGKVTAVGTGRATITATTLDGKKTAKCIVTVEKEATVTAKPEATVTATPEATATAKPKATATATPEATATAKPKATATATPVATVTEIPEEGGIPDLTNAKDSENLINEGIQISNGDETLYLGEFIGITAVCFPYKWSNQNNYILKSSNENVVTVDKAHVAYAVGVGEAQITAYTVDGKYKDTIDVKVLQKMEHSYESQKIYNAECEKFGLTCNTVEDDPLSVSVAIASNNSDAIMSMMNYAHTKGYEVVKFPANQVIYIDPANTIYMKSNVSLDLNGSEIRIVPNDYQSYIAIDFKEGGINAFAGFEGGTDTTYEKYTNAKSFTYKNIGDGFFLKPIPVCEDNSLYNQGDYSGKWLKKGGLIQFNIAHVRDNNANIAIYAHYLKNGEEVYVQKMDALYGMLNNILLQPSQRLRLNADYDYDSVQFEFRANYGGTFNYTFCDCKIYNVTTDQLTNASIVNGTITGERNTKTSTYPKWASDGATESSCSIIFSQGVNNGVKNLTIKDSVGFNMSAGDGASLNSTIVSYRDFEHGAFDSMGNKVECSTMIRNKNLYDVTKWKSNKYILGYHYGYQDIEKWSHSRIYDVFYYDENKELISYEKGLMRFRQYEMPKGTCYMNIALYDGEIPTSGDGDFGGAISFIEERDIPIRNFIEGCVIENNYSTGFAACGGQRWIIKGNTWRKNTGRMPGCDIDWEDGWNYMQCDMISDNEFLSYNNVITCAGMSGSVFYNNSFYGKSIFYAKSNFYSFVKNTVCKDEEKIKGSCGNVDFGTRSDIWIYDNTFTGGGSITNSKAHSNGEYRINYINNHFSGGTNLTAVQNEYISGCDFTGNAGVVSDNIKNSTFTNCSSVRLKGTLTDCTLNNVSIYAANSEYINLKKCDLTDVNFPTGAHKVQSILLEDCNIKFKNYTSFIGYDKFKPNIVVRNSVLDLSEVNNEFNLVNAYSVEDIAASYQFSNNKVIKPISLVGYILKASWVRENTVQNKLLITLQDTNLNELEDSNKKTGNFEVVRTTTGE